MTSQKNISDVKVTRRPYGADLGIEASFSVETEQVRREWDYKKVVHLIYSPEERMYKMLVPSLCFKPNPNAANLPDNYVTLPTPLPDYRYSGSAEPRKVLEKAEKDLHEVVSSMVSRAVYIAESYAGKKS